MKFIRNIKVAASSLLVLAALTLNSCSSDFLDPEVSEYATAEQINEVAKSGGDAVLAVLRSNMTGAYNRMITYQDRHDAFGEMSTGLAGDLMTEDMVLPTRTQFIFDYEVDNRSASYARPSNTWNYCYAAIGTCNEVIGQIPADATDVEIKALLGEALALRAYMFHTLVQRFQQTYVGNEDKPGIVLPLTANDDRESVQGRASVREAYNKILTDYDSAVSYLKNAPKRADKTTIDYQVAAGLFARALMTVGEWEKAARYANEAKAGYTLMTGEELVANGFNNIGNKEWMWGADITGETTTMFASFFSHVCSYDEGYGESTFGPKLIDSKLYGRMSIADNRRGWFKSPTALIDSKSEVTEENAPAYCNFKFKKVTGWLADYIYMRASEMYLIEAEALAQQGKEAEAYGVMKPLMDNRDTTWSKSRTTANVEEIFLQKRLELWGEGHIFYDYLRLKKGIDRTYEGSNHYVKVKREPGSWYFIYQLPQREIDNNQALSESDQNPGTGA